MKWILAVFMVFGMGCSSFRLGKKDKAKPTKKRKKPRSGPTKGRAHHIPKTATETRDYSTTIPSETTKVKSQCVSFRGDLKITFKLPYPNNSNGVCEKTYSINSVCNLFETKKMLYNAVYYDFFQSAASSEDLIFTLDANREESNILNEKSWKEFKNNGSTASVYVLIKSDSKLGGVKCD